FELRNFSQRDHHLDETHRDHHDPDERSEAVNDQDAENACDDRPHPCSSARWKADFAVLASDTIAIEGPLPLRVEILDLLPELESADGVHKRVGLLLDRLDHLRPRSALVSHDVELRVAVLAGDVACL